MNNLVGRTHEVELIESAITALSDVRALVPTPIVQFYGPHGMGKTTLLRAAQNQCESHQISYIWANGSEDDSFWTSIQNQANERLGRHSKALTTAPQEATMSIRGLLEKGPTVMLIDGLDEAGEKNLGQIETMVEDLIGRGKLFVATSSKLLVPFEKTRSLARKLTPVPLSSLDRDACEIYVSSADHLGSNAREIILDWSCGYPLALSIFTRKTVRNQIDFSQPDYEQEMLQILNRDVIEAGVLADAPRDRLVEYISLMTVLSVPRRFNLTFMQELIETFAPQYKFGSSIGYLSLPKKIYQTTGLLNWSLARAGFSIESPIREIFLLKLRSENPDLFVELHKTAAKINRGFIGQTTGSDRIRYLREYLYHTAQVPSQPSDVEIILHDFVRPVLTKEVTEIHVQFREELEQDPELKMALGENYSLLQTITEDSINSEK